ncbi:fibronectin type III domain-containing protein [Pedobacter ureilyticus]|jgi:hypothetical protein|uniref:Fibronectin type III domain-containing protein n=1 Tax=Pedobacter ureilyticus TaxID=1393051 RepID=A0ABW9J1V3_9SPHI|nr:fibronectin type III domain-containing protein [Pedobacter helvus]
MKNQKLILDYNKLADAALTVKAINIKNGLTDNDNFPTTVPSLADFTLLQEAFDLALSKTVSADRIQIALKNQARATLLAAMRQLALDIDAQANGDRAKLLSSGFDLAANGETATTITAPTEFRLLDGINAGELKLTCKRVLNAVSYLFEYTDEAPTEATKWTVQPASSREFTLRGLRSGARIYARIKAIGRRGQEANSEVLSRLVQ